jgi:O-antigen ligase
MWTVAPPLWHRPSTAVAVTILLVGLPGGVGDVSDSGHVTPADLGAAAVVAIIAARLLAGERAASRRGFIPFALVLAALALATVTASDVAAGLLGFARYAELFVLVPIAVALALRDRLDVWLVAGAVVVVTVTEAAVGTYQSMTGTGATYGGQYLRAVGTFGADEVQALGAIIGYGLIVTLALGLAARGRTRVALLSGSVLLIGPLGLTLSRGAWIATAGAGLIVLVRAGWRVAVTVLGGAALGAAFFVLATEGTTAGGGTLDQRLTSITSAGSAPDQSVLDRYALWHAAVAIWVDHPVLGVGLKDFAAYRDSYAPVSLSAGSDVGAKGAMVDREPLLSAHNQYLMVLSEQGTVGALAFGTLLAGLGLGSLRRRDSGLPPAETRFLDLAAPGVMVWTLIDFVYGDVGAGPTSVLLAVVLGLAARRSLVVPEARGRVVPGAPAVRGRIAPEVRW